MSNKIKMIFNLITLTLTFGLLMVVCFAWYATNKVASVSGGSASVVEISSLIKEIKYYKFTGKTETTTTSTLTGATVETSGFEMVTYNPLDSSTVTEIIIRIELTGTCNISKVECWSDATCFIGYDNETNPGYITSKTGLSLSSVIEYTLLSNVSESGTSVSFDIPSCTHFTFNDDGSIKDDKISLGSLDNTQYLYLLVNYDDDYLSDFYGNNIGNAVMDTEGNFSYTADFMFQIDGEAV